jgi:excisionase family DNA binding protein
VDGFPCPPVSPNSGPVTSGVLRRHLDLMELPEVLLVSEVAELLRVHPSTVYALCDRGELPHARVSGAIRIQPDDLGAYVVAARSRAISVPSQGH